MRVRGERIAPISQRLSCQRRENEMKRQRACSETTPCRLCRKRARGECDCGACPDCAKRVNIRRRPPLRRQIGKRLSIVQLRARVRRLIEEMDDLKRETIRLGPIAHGIVDQHALRFSGLDVYTLIHSARGRLFDVARAFGEVVP